MIEINTGYLIKQAIFLKMDVYGKNTIARLKKELRKRDLLLTGKQQILLDRLNEDDLRRINEKYLLQKMRNGKNV